MINACGNLLLALQTMPGIGHAAVTHLHEAGDQLRLLIGKAVINGQLQVCSQCSKQFPCCRLFEVLGVEVVDISAERTE